jgi:hypothetical protein
MKSIEEILMKIEEEKKEKYLKESKYLTEILEIQKKQKEEHLRRLKIYENSLQINNNTLSSNSGGTIFKDIPEDFYISTLVNSSELLYYTDSFRRIDLESYLDPSINVRNSNEIVRNGSDFYLCGNFGPSDTYFIKLTNCKLKNGVIFHFDKIEHRVITSYINLVHGICFYKGYIYLASRSTTTIVARINTSNIDDINTLTLPSTYLNRQTTDIIAYKDFVYIMPSLTGSPAAVIKIDLTLGTYSQIITTGTSSSSRRVRTSSAYLIYNDEIFIPMIVNTISGFSQLGMEVWGLDGVIKRQTYSQPINAGTPSLTPLAHWMGVYNDKLIISNAVMGTTTSHRSLVRMDISTLAIEESIPMDTLITDDNSIFSDGYIYLNGEAPGNIYVTGSWDIDTSKTPNPTTKLIKIKYNDFADRVDLISDLGYGSYGSLNPTSYII